jgi:hypothetical protein
MTTLIETVTPIELYELPHLDSVETLLAIFDIYRDALEEGCSDRDAWTYATMDADELEGWLL